MLQLLQQSHSSIVIGQYDIYHIFLCKKITDQNIEFDPVCVILCTCVYIYLQAERVVPDEMVIKIATGVVTYVGIIFVFLLCISCVGRKGEEEKERCFLCAFCSPVSALNTGHSNEWGANPLRDHPGFNLHIKVLGLTIYHQMWYNWYSLNIIKCSISTNCVIFLPLPAPCWIHVHLWKTVRRCVSPGESLALAVEEGIPWIRLEPLWRHPLGGSLCPQCPSHNKRSLSPTSIIF